MRLSVPALVPLVPLLSGCVITVSTDADDDVNGDSDGDSSTSATESSSSTDDSGTSETTTDTSTGSNTSTDTGGEELCGLSEGPADPWLVLSQADMAIVDDSTVSLECGGQGSVMIRFDVAMGGFVPATPEVPVHVVLDVEGYNLGTNGHFAEFDYTLFVGCCSEDYNSPDYCYGDPMQVTLFPPDGIPDIEVVHGLPATLTLTLTTGGEPVEQSIAVQMWAMPDESWAYCLGGYYGTGYGTTGYGTTGGFIEPLGISPIP